ncbi:MAG: glutathione peroxidase [Chitinophagia bacterium]|nr:glutathione peroxidase [Chitinophagia bacterium]
MKKKDMTYRQSILKTIYPAIMWSTGKAGSKQVQVNTEMKKGTVEFYSLTTKDIAGNTFSFEQFKGKKVLIVNTASDCGYTAQYENLEKLSKQFAGSLVVVGFPANDFKNQETKDDQAIAAFCQKNYGVSFPLMSKSVVIKSNNQNPVYAWLTAANLNGWCNQAPAWNFCKYLINEQGVLTHYFPMSVDPLDAQIIKAINQ